MTGKYLGLALLTFTLVAGCASPAPDDGTSAPGPAQPTTLVMVVNTEVSNLSQKAVGPTNPSRTTRIFNADLSLQDRQGNVHPYLAESLPQLNTETWRVFPDGRMETTWKLRPGLTWHDGQPLTVEDFVFAFRVYSAPGMQGIFESIPQDRIERLTGVEPQTIRVEWGSPFLHTGSGLGPLPRAHLSEPFAAFQQDGQRDAFMALRFWTTGYVGAGPYRLTQWEPAVYLEGEAFDGHALGRPKIDRVVVRLINDENTALTNILSGHVHLTMTQAIRFEHAMILRQQGGFNDTEKKGKIHYIASSTTTAVPQHRPEYQQTPGLLDLRVRKAIAHAIDRAAINEGVFDGAAPVPYTFVDPEASYAEEINRSVTRHPYDPKRTEQLMIEAGYSRGAGGFFVDPRGERFRPAVWNSAGAQREKMVAILLDTWQRAGLEAEGVTLPAALERDQQARATYPGILVHGISTGTTSLSSLTTEQIGTPANRWGGQNRGGWSHPDFDLLWDRYNGTLVLSEQIQAYVQMMKLDSEHVVRFPLHYSLNVVTHVAALKGPQGDASHWNVHQWELTS